MTITVPKFSDAHKLREAVKHYGQTCEAFGFSLADKWMDIIPEKRNKMDQALNELNALISKYVDNVVRG
ncbi:hypothetical protein LCGC14_1184140 [marine sediment metagenome]|uniref:Uncharacterized protein n=1 Tax=marine sediment metagenome TaxID=412755 RepID=A0A0F9LLE5_9ZZZZ|nr:hypothetical protein [Candidatus Aminicenantes bacterium]